jgi:hypothetical protein
VTFLLTNILVPLLVGGGAAYFAAKVAAGQARRDRAHERRLAWLSSALDGVHDYLLAYIKRSLDDGRRFRGGDIVIEENHEDQLEPEDPRLPIWKLERVVAEAPAYLRPEVVGYLRDQRKCLRDADSTVRELLMSARTSKLRGGGEQGRTVGRDKAFQEAQQKQRDAIHKIRDIFQHELRANLPDT